MITVDICVLRVRAVSLEELLIVPSGARPVRFDEESWLSGCWVITKRVCRSVEDGMYTKKMSERIGHVVEVACEAKEVTKSRSITSFSILSYTSVSYVKPKPLVPRVRLDSEYGNQTVSDLIWQI
jgi:hypothetical protein